MFIGAIGHHTGDQALVEWLLGEILIVLLEVLFRRCDELHGDKFVATRRMSLLGWERRICLDIDIPTLLEAGDDVSNEPTLDAIRLDSNEATSNVNHTAKSQLGEQSFTFFRCSWLLILLSRLWICLFVGGDPVFLGSDI